MFQRVPMISRYSTQILEKEAGNLTNCSPYHRVQLFVSEVNDETIPCGVFVRLWDC